MRNAALPPAGPEGPAYPFASVCAAGGRISHFVSRIRVGGREFLIPNSSFLIPNSHPTGAHYQVGDDEMSSSAAVTPSGRENQ
jgi:hypothetical protein